MQNKLNTLPQERQVIEKKLEQLNQEEESDFNEKITFAHKEGCWMEFQGLLFLKHIYADKLSNHQSSLHEKIEGMDVSVLF